MIEFLDFSTLDKRHFYCLEEIRINRRCASELYCDVIAIRQLNEGDFILSNENEGIIVDYAVMMKEFPQNSLFSNQLANNQGNVILIVSRI